MDPAWPSGLACYFKWREKGCHEIDSGHRQFFLDSSDFMKKSFGQRFIGMTLLTLLWGTYVKNVR